MKIKERIVKALSLAVPIGVSVLIALIGLQTVQWREDVTGFELLLGILTIVSLVLLVFAIVSVITGIWSYILPPSKRANKANSFEAQKPNLLWEYVKAKKQKVCLLIKVED